MAPLTGAKRPPVDFSAIASLKLRARCVADGVFAGMHRSVRRGAGIELGGFREYTPGDDLRWLDRRSLQRYERLVLRQFEMDTDRRLALSLDATRSMSFRGASPYSKFEYAALLAAALARLGLRGGDPVGLLLVGSQRAGGRLPFRTGMEQFERIVGTLEAEVPSYDAEGDPNVFERGLAGSGSPIHRGTVTVLFSDLLDVPEAAITPIARLGSSRHALVVVQVLDRAELSFPFEDHVQLTALEGDHRVETDGASARSQYLENLEALRRAWEQPVRARGGGFLRVSTDDDPVEAVRSVLHAIAGR